MALLSNKPRLASIVCEEDCHFAVLSKEDFDRILKQATEKNYLKEIENLGRLPIFQGWNSLQLRRIYLNSYRQTYLRKQCVF
jgi:CRP-like cAMP-binding protein